MDSCRQGTASESLKVFSCPQESIFIFQKWIPAHRKQLEKTKKRFPAHRKAFPKQGNGFLRAGKLLFYQTKGGARRNNFPRTGSR